MSQHQAFKRVAVPTQVAQKLDTVTLPAPTRGIIQSENETYMQPGAAVVCDNWVPTMKGLKLRGGCTEWCQLPETTPVISGFEYVSDIKHEIFVANATKVYNVTTSLEAEIASGRTSGNYVASQLANAAGDWLIVVNDAGDSPLRYNGTAWEVLDAGQITNIPTAGLSYVCKYRNRFFFIELNSMNAWYLPLNAVGGALAMIPLSGAATKGGKLLFCATWSIDAGDGIDDKLCFVTDQGEAIIFTGSDPGSAANWRQEGRYNLSPPLGMNAHIAIGGDLLVATVDGILPMSGAITKDRAELELAAITRNIKPLWREEVIDKREFHWTICKWDEYGGVFVALPGGRPGKYRCFVANAATGAWTRFTGWDAMFFVRMRGDMFFGTQTGRVMQADRTGYDDGQPYVAVFVGGWEMFSSPSQTITWRQARGSFAARPNEPFRPQIAAATDYIVKIPPPPTAGTDVGVLLDLWDQGLWGPNVSGFYPLWKAVHVYGPGDKAYDSLTENNWDCAIGHTSPATGTFEAYRTANPTHWTLAAAPTPSPPPSPGDRETYAQWDGPSAPAPVARNTGWVSVGATGYSHAPIVQVTVAQQARPDVTLISIAATFERAGVNV